MESTKNDSFFITLNEEELKNCREYAEFIVSKLDRRKNYGQKVRSKDEVKNEAFAGKICEAAAKQFFKSRNVEMLITYIHNEKVDVDLISPNKRIVEVKCSKQNAKWLLVPWEDIRNKQNQLVEPDVYLMCRIKWESVNSTPTVEIVGYASKKQMRADYPKTRDFRRGDLLPGTSNTYLDNNNIGRHVNDLSKNWNILDEYLTETITHK